VHRLLLVYFLLVVCPWSDCGVLVRDLLDVMMFSAFQLEECQLIDELHWLKRRHSELSCVSIHPRRLC
jgi:hypothetical protein